MKEIKTNNQTKQLKTELIFILDRSGSMRMLENETINGYNSVIKKQSEVDGELKITTVLFDNEYEIVYDGVNPSKAKLTDKQYFVRGTTALLDAVGKTITLVEARHRRLLKQDIPDKVIVAITTDGYENASFEYSFKTIKSLIEKKSKDGWEFMFLAANINEQTVGDELGIKSEYRSKFNASKTGVKEMSEKMCSMMYDIRCRK